MRNKFRFVDYNTLNKNLRCKCHKYQRTLICDSSITFRYGNYLVTVWKDTNVVMLDLIFVD